ncbi:hypothetical protein [Pseudomonas soli]|uniref:hypothetical protein n=1 Tax=Pseudomonas soli TaxID=1306993 RepID=UPI00345D68DE
MTHLGDEEPAGPSGLLTLAADEGNDWQIAQTLSRVPERDRLERRERILRGYLLGQLAVIANFAIYYSLFSPVAAALAGVGGMGQGRSLYSAAVAIFQPIAGVLAERIAVRSILIGGFAIRALIWAVILPIGYLALSTGAPLLTLFLLLMLIDGVVVSIGSLVDIDEGGLDLLGQQHGFPVDDDLRNRYNSIYEGFTSIGRIIMAPLMATLGLVMASVLNSAADALVIVMALGFLLPAMVGAYFYLRYIPSDPVLPARVAGASALDEVVEIYGGLRSGLQLTWRLKRIRWRILLNSAERAIEDSMLLIVLATFALKVLAPEDLAKGAFYTALLIAVGKVGSIVSAWAMHKYWRAPSAGMSQWASYKFFFPLAFAGTLATALMPVAVYVALAGALAVAAVLAALSAILFNLLFTASSLGFRNLMQGIVSEAGASGRVLGIQGMFIMGTSALAILGLSAIFETMGLLAAFITTSAIYIGYGILQLLYGRRLIFSDSN